MVKSTLCLLDDAMINIQDYIGEIIRSSQGEDTEKIDATERETAQNMFKIEAVQTALRSLWLRSSISTDMTFELRNFEISTRGGLWLPERELMNFIRQLETKHKNKEEGAYAIGYDNN